MTRMVRASRRATRTAVAALVLLGAATLSPLPAQVVERFDADPLTGQSHNVFFGEGDVAARFTFVPEEPSHFPADREGTLRVVYDTTFPTARLSTPIGQSFSTDADFDFGAILTIRSEGFFADPNGFSQIALACGTAPPPGSTALRSRPTALTWSSSITSRMSPSSAARS